MANLLAARKDLAHMEVIPVLDLKGGVVVHARMGQRGQYRPIETPLSPTSNPIDVTRGLLSLYPFRTIYIADLDAIMRTGDNTSTVTQFRDAFPHLIFWVDNGVADRSAAQDWLDAGLGHLVLGSETQQDAALVRSLLRDDRIILSLDYRGDAFVGPQALLSATDAWPRRLIAMTLAQVGSAMGPDWRRLSAIKRDSAEKLVYAAGGVRNADDLAVLARMGIAGALVASCLHNGELAGAQIARLQAT
jgi:phosphoribosylformimino-5-aminoimidazole carboxamide ribotide isomerase